MKKITGIAVFVLLMSVNSLHARQDKIDVLVNNLNQASSFIIANNAFYIIERGAHRVVKTNLNGEIIDTYGKRGSGNFQFDKPHSIVSSTGLKIYVSDPGNNRVQVFDKRWQYLSSITAEKQFQNQREIEPTFLGINKLGEVIFYDRRNKSLGKYDEDGAFLDNIPLPDEIKSVDGLQIKDEKIFILDKKSGFIHRMSSNGFYETYYGAKDTDAVFSGNDFFRISKDQLTIDKDGALRSISLTDKIENPVQILVIEGQVYILSENKLLKISGI